VEIYSNTLQQWVQAKVIQAGATLVQVEYDQWERTLSIDSPLLRRLMEDQRACLDARA
jgi:hypothetical protein